LKRTDPICRGITAANKWGVISAALSSRKSALQLVDIGMAVLSSAGGCKEQLPLFGQHVYVCFTVRGLPRQQQVPSVQQRTSSQWRDILALVQQISMCAGCICAGNSRSTLPGQHTNYLISSRSQNTTAPQKMRSVTASFMPEGKSTQQQTHRDRVPAKSTLVGRPTLEHAAHHYAWPEQQVELAAACSVPGSSGCQADNWPLCCIAALPASQSQTLLLPAAGDCGAALGHTADNETMHLGILMP